ncbi:MAG: large conductance mechanosensitive channel protein MscL [Christensenellales bacterium]
MWKEFKQFAFKGNVMDLAIGVMIGAAFQSIVKSLVDDIFMPLFGLILNTATLNAKYVVLKGADLVTEGMTAAEATAAGASVLTYGSFISAVINFFLIAVIVFFIVKLINKLKDIGHKPVEEEAKPEPRLCPYCKSVVADDATRCPHCTSILDAPAREE